ncbi:bifunctional 23S rRNA (guanine(2069)-N(7))-methyltransferase RlmK/23S rRNA (guanine(2445)-N(2))-methyltransferase RlmL [Methylomonas albis]|uniref:Ribosomal RNA large subunit methyltransferase K/L n=1 Tax=Methylomonas albis TaxID=1854563 RepID=A0ABR9D5D8_9GAMM|nr:bifunctional 23S rRNA (guanine(2069)-N(7))-methyltransferase RlmK/23S rRNA (guanine(2445)-N(2))-methyltransferase RlmL [Methylomonas albis]MBD9358340.1 bifunctional 23S rRNA (guanine(2069)-N(7))-methyltransferase RlmK/23S rRNA (guanine(2445)-N(2))-methyltransferase RlmL [Methylomonas albis]
MSQYQLFATTPKAMEGILATEIKALGGQNVREKMAGVAFEGDLALAYRVCLWSRTANRVFLPLSSFEVKSQQDLYDGVKKINWFEHIKPDDSLAVSFSSKNNPAINNTHFGALKVKDAIVDQMRAKFNKRPNIDTERPSIRVNVYLHNETAQLSLDLSGESLHRRGYRDVNIAAPIKENLAAAILLRAGWPKIAEQGGSLLDPMCGSGTMLLEGAMIAADYAPGLQRDYFGFLGWKKHDAALWQSLLDEAKQRRDIGLNKMPVIVGFDQDRRTVVAALQHVDNAGLTGKIHIERRDIADATAADSWPKGLIACNPPYGERLGDEAETSELYRRFGEVLKQRFVGWQVAMIISNPELGFRLGVRSQKPITLFNGALECKLLRFNIEEQTFFEPKAKSQQERIEQISRRTETEQPDNQADMFANRLRKNLKKIGKWAKQNQVSCYRLYDADLPEYAVAVDVYLGEKTWVNVQEYESPKTIDPAKANQRLAGAMVEIPKVLEIPKEQVFLKIRRKQKSTDQYEKQGESGRFHVVEEGGCKFWVNFEDYLDTGLFLDHRPIRLMIQQQAKGKRFLNLFAYTGSASVHAAVGGAASSVTVDMSNTYLDWAKRNFDLNGIQGDHKLLRANCVEWLAEQAGGKDKPQFDLIFLDPPTFSNSKKMDEAFDIQNDHLHLLRSAVALLAPEGVLYFSTNFRRFKLDRQALADLQIEDISAKTIPEDFARDQKIHYCWRISR